MDINTETAALFIDHFNENNADHRKELTANILPALERERGIVRDLHVRARDYGEDTAELISKMKTLSLLIKKCRDTLAPKTEVA